MSVEFTAVADCPKCGNIAVHWLDEPIPWPASNAEYDRMLKLYTATQIFCGAAEFLIDPVDCVVARVCRECEHRWPMK